MTFSNAVTALSLDIITNDVIDTIEIQIKVESSYLCQNLGQMSGKKANDNNKKINGNDRIKTSIPPISAITR
jgi:hypothetical protein